jgi:hypothetical protein
MDQTDVKRLARQMALELLVTDLLALHFLRSGNVTEVAAAYRAGLRKIIDQQAIPGLDPAQSALVVGELGDALDEIVAEAQAAAARKSRG